MHDTVPVHSGHPAGAFAASLALFGLGVKHALANGPDLATLAAFFGGLGSLCFGVRALLAEFRSLGWIGRAVIAPPASVSTIPVMSVKIPEKPRAMTSGRWVFDRIGDSPEPPEPK